MDTIQAVVADHLLDKLDYICSRRIENSLYLDKKLRAIKEVYIPDRNSDVIRQVFHIYSINVERRDSLKIFLEKRGIDAKIHYPIPMHLQPAALELGYKMGDFPVAEKLCQSTLSLPVHEFITSEQLDQTFDAIKEFYS